MDTLPISTLPTPSAPSGAECAADADASTSTPPEGGFQAVLSRSLAGGAQDATDAGAAAQDAASEDATATADDSLATVAEGALNASDSALALLAALPQQAARPEALSPGASAGPGIGDAIKGESTSPIDDRAGRGAAAIAARRPDDLTAPGKGLAPLRPGDAASLAAADREKIGEIARAGALVADPNTAATHQTAHAAYIHTSLVAPDPVASAPAPVAQPRIDTPLGAPGWSTALADQLVMFAGEKQQVAELRINPPHLGPVDITLTMHDDQASAVFASPHAIVRETIESALPRLREVLAESGINLGQASVTADSPRDGSAQAQSRSSFPTGGERSGAEVTHPIAATLPVRRALPGRVDLFA